MQAVSKVVNLTDNEVQLKEQAFRHYCNLRVSRLQTIADRVGVPLERVREWHARDNWLQRRSELRDERERELFKEIRSPKNCAMESLKVACMMHDLVKARVEVLQKGEIDTYVMSEMQKGTQMLRQLSEIRAECFKQLGIENESTK